MRISKIFLIICLLINPTELQAACFPLPFLPCHHVHVHHHYHHTRKVTKYIVKEKVIVKKIIHKPIAHRKPVPLLPPE